MYVAGSVEQHFAPIIRSECVVARSECGGKREENRKKRYKKKNTESQVRENLTNCKFVLSSTSFLKDSNVAVLPSGSDVLTKFAATSSAHSNNSLIYSATQLLHTFSSIKSKPQILVSITLNNLCLFSSQRVYPHLIGNGSLLRSVASSYSVSEPAGVKVLYPQLSLL